MTVAGQEPVYYTYDANSRMTDLQSGMLNFGFEYDELGRRTSTTLPNGITTTYTYDNASNLLELSHLSATEIIEKLTYAYDPNGNRTSMERANVVPEFPDPASNITYNQANQMLAFDGESPAYDLNGNLIQKGGTFYLWNARNQLVGINGPDVQASFKYDAIGRRIEKTINGKTTQYLYDGLDSVQEIESGMVSANYIRTVNIDEPLARVKADGTVRFYQQDALGSVIALTDENGVVKTTYTYGPFGNVTATGEASDQPFQFAGRENDDTGLLYERFRYYSFELQRYISQDPAGLLGGDVNFYVRAFNNPVLFIDPSGLESSTLRNNINIGPTTRNYASAGDLLPIAYGVAAVPFWNLAIDDAQRAIFDMQRRLPYNQTRTFYILYGTRPIRFVGLEMIGEDSLAEPDVFGQGPVTIRGLFGLPRLDIGIPPSALPTGLCFSRAH